ncbi:MAG: membrane protein insertase YidC [Candidatus Omnitrophota bacterium]|nr:membrane protein insertase YidC [Candidatus Omnitrophota bacterium]
MEKRLITAVTLSIITIVMFQFLFPAPKKTQAAKPEERAIVKEIDVKSFVPAMSIPTDGEKESAVATDRSVVTFSDIGGAVKKIELKKHKKHNSIEPLILVEEKDPSRYIFSIKDSSGALPLESSKYSIGIKPNQHFDPSTLLRVDGEQRRTIDKLSADPELLSKDQVIYTLNLKDLQIAKQYTLSNSNDTIELQLFIKNTSAQPKELAYQIISGSGIVEPNMADKRLIEVTAKVDGKTVNFKRPKNNIITNPGIVSWVALKTRYFSLIMKPFGQTKQQFHNFAIGDDLVAGIEMERVTIPADSFIEQKYLLYAGPSIASELKKIGMEFEETINYGFFGWIAKALLFMLGLCHSVVKSWGLSVIILSVLLNVLLFPLTLKSFQSMQKMHELHPQMEKLKAQFKDNPQKLNKEVMELYKKYNINPLGGCLPLLLQMPIFIALYQALTKSIDLRGASFLWIKDLSMPDAVAIPATLPLIGNHINILPLAMVVLMVFQQKVSTKVMGSAVTEEQKQQQKMMLIMMPVMFGFIFYSMPSGMVLYWVVNTLLTIVEQSAILKKT